MAYLGHCVPLLPEAFPLSSKAVAVSIYPSQPTFIRGV